MNERIREIALRFFEGTITAEEECELYGFLNGNPQGLAQMREWESCWKRDHVPPADVLDSLDSLRRKIRRRRPLRRLWLRISAAYLGCGRGAGARLDARAASPSGRKARTAFYGRGAAGHAQPYLAARRYAGVAQCGIGVELRIEFQRNLARGLPLGRSLFRGGAPCGTAVPCRSARLYVHRSRHEVRHLGLCRRSRRDGCAAGRGAAFRVGGQAGGDDAGRSGHLRLCDSDRASGAGRRAAVPGGSTG